MKHIRNLTALLLVCLTLTGAAQAPANWRTTTSASYRYGQQLTFNLTVAAADPVSDVMLAFQAPGLPYRYTVTSAAPGPAPFSVTHTIDLTDPALDWTLSPFAEVTYEWSLAAGGERIVLPAESFYYDDQQFDWRRWENGSVRVYWPGSDAEMGSLVAEIVTESETAFAEYGLGPIPAGLRVFVYPTAGDLRAGMRLAGADWTAGHASAALPVLVILAGKIRVKICHSDWIG